MNTYLCNPPITCNYAYDMGYDAGKNGANTTNCHFSLFSRPELTKAWESGKARAGIERQRSAPIIACSDRNSE